MARFMIPEPGVTTDGLDWPPGEIAVSDDYWASRLRAVPEVREVDDFVTAQDEVAGRPKPAASLTQDSRRPEQMTDNELVAELIRRNYPYSSVPGMVDLLGGRTTQQAAMTTGDLPRTRRPGQAEPPPSPEDAEFSSMAEIHSPGHRYPDHPGSGDAWGQDLTDEATVRPVEERRARVTPDPDHLLVKQALRVGDAGRVGKEQQRQRRQDRQAAEQLHEEATEQRREAAEDADPRRAEPPREPVQKDEEPPGSSPRPPGPTPTPAATTQTTSTTQTTQPPTQKDRR